MREREREKRRAKKCSRYAVKSASCVPDVDPFVNMVLLVRTEVPWWWFCGWLRVSFFHRWFWFPVRCGYCCLPIVNRFLIMSHSSAGVVVPSRRKKRKKLTTSIEGTVIVRCTGLSLSPTADPFPVVMSYASVSSVLRHELYMAIRW